MSPAYPQQPSPLKLITLPPQSLSRETTNPINTPANVCHEPGTEPATAHKDPDKTFTNLIDTEAQDVKKVARPPRSLLLRLMWRHYRCFVFLMAMLFNVALIIGVVVGVTIAVMKARRKGY